MSHEILVGSKQELLEAAASRFERRAREAIAERGRFAVALPGGSAAESYFAGLARRHVDWSRTDFFWSDERAVPRDDPRSNFSIAERLWLGPAAVPERNVHRMRGELADLDQAAAEAEAGLLECLGPSKRLDWLWLGVGEDGHVASLFPGHPLLGERHRHVAALLDSPKPPPARLTLTLAAISAARHVVVTALGGEKAGVVGEALRHPASRLPLALALAAAAGAWLLLDGAAARELPG